MIRSGRRSANPSIRARLAAAGAVAGLLVAWVAAPVSARPPAPVLPSAPTVASGPSSDAKATRPPGHAAGVPVRAGCAAGAPTGPGGPGATVRFDPTTGRAIATTTDDRNIPGASDGAACSWLVRLAAGAKAADVTKGLPPGAVRRSFKAAVRGFAARLDARQVAALRGDPRVASVTPDWVATIDDSEAATSWGLDRIDQRNLPLSGTFQFDPTGGAGVTAYVVDTGINPASNDFTGRIGAGAGFATDNAGTADCNGHGTHVAGTLAGSVHGIARAATIVPVRVLDCGGSAPYSSILAGLDWVIADHQAGDPAVVNMSLGGPIDPSLNAAIQATIDDGIVVVVAAGNANADACGFSPASAPNAVTVGATDSTDTMASFSNYGGCLDTFAPGVGIVSAWIGGASATNTISGTSMASPHVAGIAAVLAGRNPSASPAAIAAMLTGDATSGVVNGLAGTGSVNRLAHLGPPTPGAQTVAVALGPLYLSEAPVTLEGLSTSGASPTFTSLTTSVCTVSAGKVTPKILGTCTIRASVAGGGGWLAAHVDWSVPVYAHRQTIHVPASWAELPFGGANAPAATATSGLAVSYQALSSPCTLTGTTVQGAEVGDCLLVAHQAGNASYGPADPVYFTRSVRPALQTLSGPTGKRVAVGGTLSWTASSSAGLPVDVLGATPAICDPSLGAVHGDAIGTCHLRLTQAGDPGHRPSGSSTIAALSPETPWLTRAAVRDDGRPLVAWSSGGRLHLDLCPDVACSTPVERDLVDLASRYAGSAFAPDLQFLDLAVVVGAGDRPVVVYAEQAPRPKTGGDPDNIDYVARVLACDDAACTTWTDTVVVDPDPEALVRVDTVSVTLSAAGDPIIAYTDETFGANLLICDDPACTTSAHRDLDLPDATDYGVNPAVTLDGAGRPVIAYLRTAWNSQSGLMEEWATPVIARCADATCTSMTKTTVGEASRWYKPAIVVPADDRPVLFWTQDVTVHQDPHYLDFRVMQARCTNAACSGTSSGILDNTGVLEWDGYQEPWSVAGFDLSAALGPDGFPRAGYVAWVRRVPGSWQAWSVPPWTGIVTACRDAACATTTRSFVDEWARTDGWIWRGTQLSLAVSPGGTLVTALGFPSDAYTSADPRSVGVRLITCADAVCGTDATVQVVSETTPPTVTVPLVSLRTGAPVTATSLPVTVTWTGADAGSGIDHYEVARSANGGSTWSTVSTALTSPKVVTSVTSSGTVRFRVRAYDHDGNVSGWATGPTLTPRLTQQNGSGVAFSSGWSPTTTNAVYSGGSARSTSTAGRSVTFTTSARSFALVTTMGSARGQIRVYVNDVLAGTVDLHATTTSYRTVGWQRTWGTSASRTIRIVVVGTAGRPRVDIDAFAWIR